MLWCASHHNMMLGSLLSLSADELSQPCECLGQRAGDERPYTIATGCRGHAQGLARLTLGTFSMEHREICRLCMISLGSAWLTLPGGTDRQEVFHPARHAC